MAGIIVLGIPYLIGQAVGICIDVVLVKTNRSIWPFHAACMGLGLVGIGWNIVTEGEGGAPTGADYNRTMLVSLCIGLALSFLTYSVVGSCARECNA